MKRETTALCTTDHPPNLRKTTVNAVNTVLPDNLPTMPPPRMKPWLLQQIEQLKEQANRQAQVTPASPRTSKMACPPADYKQLIQHWFDREPPALRDRKYSMTEFVMRFAGRFRPKPAARLIADALRELGWTEHRDWTRAGRNRRYWLPRQSDHPSR